MSLYTLPVVRLSLLVALLVPAFVVAAASEAGSDILTVGLDVEVFGNGPRAAPDIDQCLSVSIGQPVTVDVAVPEPGVPAGAGISAYQFTLFYVNAIVSLTGDDSSMLLAAAPGSAVIPLKESTPDTDGIYASAAVDFGPKGIEPAGASETGPGVLARLTLTPHAAGVSGLVIKDVKVKDDAGDDVEIASVLSAHLYVGQPCPGQAIPTPVPSPSSPSGPTGNPGGSPGTAAGPQPSPADLARAGGRPTTSGGYEAWLTVVAVAAVAAGIAAMTAAWAWRPES